MDAREESQEYVKGTPVIFLPTPKNNYYKYSGEKGKVQFQERKGTRWYIDLDKTVMIRANSPMQKEVPIRVLGEEDEFRKI